MPTCEVCKNEYDKAFEIVVGGQRHTFDSLECAIHALAPVCPHCNCRIVGHGVESGRTLLLLRSLCARVWHNAVEGPGLSTCKANGVQGTARPTLRLGVAAFSLEPRSI